jgi:hypothetical protein
MRVRSLLGALLTFGLVMPIVSCNGSYSVSSIEISPATQSVGAGSTVQFNAVGIFTYGSHPPQTRDVTNLVTWSSSATNVATINSSGDATGVAAGTTSVTASMQGFTGLIHANASLTVTGVGSGGTNSDITSISIIPSSQSVPSPGGTAQFIPIGSTSSGSTVNLTGSVTWSSSSAQIATIDASTGVATGVSQGSATITAVYTNPDKTVATGTATFQVISGSTQQSVTALTMFPTSQGATAQAQQSQFTVLGTENGLQYDVTDQVVWSSSNLAVATIGTAGDGTPGLATAVGAGTTTIEAKYINKDGSEVVTTGAYSVTIGAAQEPLLSINVVPAGTTVSNKSMTGQYLAFGTYSTTPTIRDLTNQVTWLSLLPEVASISSGGTSGENGGLATAQGYTGSTVIYAEMTNPDGTVVLSNPQQFTCKDPTTQVCNQEVATPQFATVTVFIAGEQTAPSGEYVTAPSDTGTPNLIHCGQEYTGSGGQVCTGTYAVGSQVVLTENLPAGSSYFGGWSSGSGCAEAQTNPANLATSQTCTITLTGNKSVGVIFY